MSERGAGMLVNANFHSFIDLGLSVGLRDVGSISLSPVDNHENEASTEPVNARRQTNTNTNSG